MSEKTKIKILRVLWYGIMILLWYTDFILALLGSKYRWITFALAVTMGAITMIINERGHKNEQSHKNR